MYHVNKVSLDERYARFREVDLYFNRLYGWGNNDFGQLGLTYYNEGPNDSKRRLTSLNNWKSVQCGFLGIEITVAIQNDGTLWSWGRNRAENWLDQQVQMLGISYFSQDKTNYPHKIVNWDFQYMNDIPWVKVTRPRHHIFALKEDGSLWRWGFNDFGQLGIGNTINQSSPNSEIYFSTHMTDWMDVSCGYESTMAIKKDGTMWGCGYNWAGNLGNGDTNSRSVFTQVIGGDWKSVSCGDFITFAIKNDGSLWGWGENWANQLGLGHTDDVLVPTLINNFKVWKEVSASSSNTLAVAEDGTLWGCGDNWGGQLGLGHTEEVLNLTQIGVLSNWKSVVCGADLTFAIKTDGTLWGMGWNGDGYLGIPELLDEEVLSPVQIGFHSDWKQISNGRYHTIGIR